MSEDLDFKQVNKDVSTAKRLWKQKQKVISYDDEISKAENALFVDNVELSELVQKRAAAEKDIVDYVSATLSEHRTKVGGKKEAPIKERVIRLLEEIQHEFTTMNNVICTDKVPVDDEDLVLTQNDCWTNNYDPLLYRIELTLINLKEE